MCVVRVYQFIYRAFIVQLLCIYYLCLSRNLCVIYVCLDEENRRSSQGVISGIRKNVVMVLP